MGVEDSPPDLVMRAVGRLGGQLNARVEPAADVAKPDTKSHIDVPPRVVAVPATERNSGEEKTKSRRVDISPTALVANKIYALSGENQREVEEYRVIKRHIVSNAARNAKEGPLGRNRTIMVTSARPGEGKTFTAINVAFALARERDVHVLLVDADAYRHSAFDYLGVKADTGWVDYLAREDLSLDDILLSTNLPSLSLIAAGQSRGNIPELMSSKKMARFVQDLTDRLSNYFIVFDGLPCLGSNEPAILASLVGQIVFVVAAHKTSKRQVEASLRQISACPSVSLLLNKAEPLLTETLGYGYGYGYGYGHGDQPQGQ